MTKREKIAVAGFGAFALALGIFFFFGRPVKAYGITEITVYALRPTMQQRREPPTSLFYKFPILGSTTVTDSKRIYAITNSLNADIGAFVLKGCDFSPRHGVSIHYGSKIRDYVICYECGDVEAFDGGQMTSFSLNNQNSKETLTGILSTAGIAIAP